jgi:hypothetical protein
MHAGFANTRLLEHAAEMLTPAGCRCKRRWPAFLRTRTQRVIRDATHASLIDDQGDSANSIQAILDVVEAVRSGATLQP